MPKRAATLRLLALDMTAIRDNQGLVFCRICATTPYSNYWEPELLFKDSKNKSIFDQRTPNITASPSSANAAIIMFASLFLPGEPAEYADLLHTLRTGYRQLYVILKT